MAMMASSVAIRIDPTDGPRFARAFSRAPQFGHSDAPGGASVPQE